MHPWRGTPTLVRSETPVGRRGADALIPRVPAPLCPAPVTVPLIASPWPHCARKAFRDRGQALWVPQPGATLSLGTPYVPSPRGETWTGMHVGRGGTEKGTTPRDALEEQAQEGTAASPQSTAVPGTPPAHTQNGADEDGVAGDGGPQDPGAQAKQTQGQVDRRMRVCSGLRGALPQPTRGPLLLEAGSVQASPSPCSSAACRWLWAHSTRRCPGS